MRNADRGTVAVPTWRTLETRATVLPPMVVGLLPATVIAVPPKTTGAAPFLMVVPDTTISGGPGWKTTVFTGTRARVVAGVTAKLGMGKFVTIPLG